MIRKVPLLRSYMKPKPPRRLLKETEEEREYKAWLHTLPCVVTGYEGDQIQAAHMGEGGLGQKKGTWFEAVPMRFDVHADWDQRKGQFEGWDDDHRAAQSDAWTAETKYKWHLRASDRG